ncbi:histidine kinase [Novosphingobium sp. 1949]|uniref:histidine kinase n=1 Tax=Novosphingobium organovorum TaxID=2930092 RepID=A0ABT0BB99_9SPHN|nr:histidine kinase [Novosphingobium organovorum]MCJ2182229.1 histidine kinase [Novosphingobium organovorum]
MADVSENPRVPARMVLLSLAALWACYFILATLRGAFMGLDFVWPIISRRLTICLLSAMVMAAVWPLLQMLDRKSNGMRLLIVLVGALPLALLLSVINAVVFADIEMAMKVAEKEGMTEVDPGQVRIMQDEAGNILVDLPKPPPPPSAPAAAATPQGEASAVASSPVSPDAVAEPVAPAAPDTPAVQASEPTGHGITIRANGRKAQEGLFAEWAAMTDTTFGRYFLVLAWAALYFALAKAEEARAAERREGEYRRAAEAAELRSLRYQVNPHFLFNTLNSLSALVMTGRQDDAETMIQTLSTFYRHTLAGDPTGDMTLTDEIEMQKLYLAIEAVRFPNRLQTRIDVDETAADAMVPGMILQPLVENSVKYAVAATQRPVTIAIRARAEGNRLVLTVCDDGPGVKPSKAEGCGIGLANVRDRLRARYGSQADLSFGTQEGGGHATVLNLPLETKALSRGPLEFER